MRNSFSLQRLLLQPSPVWHLRAAAVVSSASSKKATWASRCTESSVSWCSCECDSLARAAAKFIPVWVLPRCLSSLGTSSLRCCSFGRGYPTPPSSRANSHQLRKQLRVLRMKEKSGGFVQGSVPSPQPRVTPGLRGAWRCSPCLVYAREKGGRKRSRLPFILQPTCKHVLREQ